MKIGTTIASAVATPPIVEADARSAPLLTPKPLGSAIVGSWPSGRPQRAICRLSWR